MADNKFPDNRLQTSDLPAGQDKCESELLVNTGESHCKELHTVVESLSLLVGVALAPLCGKDTKYCCTCDACRCLAVRLANVQSVQLQLQFFISKADDMQRSLLAGVSDQEVLAASVPSFLYTCQPYFNHLESTARSTLNENSPLHESARAQLLDFSQMLCNRLEKLVLTFASYGLLCLDESDPNSISHFYIGQCRLGPVRLTMFRYCEPTPYLAQVNTGLYKRMRWNVERLQDMAQLQLKDQRGEMEENTEYYFLCCEDMNTQPDRDNQGISHGSNIRMWSIGQWVQLSPDTDDINDWVICRIPKGKYQRLVFLGSEEPSCSTSTDYLLQLLLSQQ